MEKVEFIICVNHEKYKNQCVAFINELIVPSEINISITLIDDADSMTSAYNRAMKASDAKYKVYLHQDVFIINKNFISEFITVFSEHPEVGLLGVIGSKNVIKNGCYWNAWDVGETYAATPLNFFHLKCCDSSDMEYVRVVDGMLMITQYDVNWREDIFDAFDFYDISQSEEFHRAGYQVAIPYQKKVWCIHDCGYSKLQRYDIYRERFCWLYADEYLYEELEDQNARRKLEILEKQLLNIIVDRIDNGNVSEVEFILNQVEQMSSNNTELVILYVMFCLEQEEKSGEKEAVVYGSLSKSNTYIDTFLKYKFMLQRIVYDIPLGEYTGLWNSTVGQYGKKRLIEKLSKIVSDRPQMVLDKMMCQVKVD